MNLLPNKTNGDSPLKQARKRRPSKMNILRASLLALMLTMMILGGATFSNLFTSAAHAASKATSTKAVQVAPDAGKAARMMPHVGMAKAGRAMPRVARVGSTPPDLAITSVTPSGLPAGPIVETIAMSNLGGPAFRDATTPNFVQVNIQVSGLIAVNAAGTLTAPTASGTGWSCGTATASKTITLTLASGITPAVPVTYSFICNYTGAFPIATGPLNSITVTGTTLFAGLGAAITTLPINVQLVTLYDTNTGNNNFFVPGTFITTDFALAPFTLAGVNLSKTVVSGTPPFAPGQNITYRLTPSVSSLTAFQALLAALPTTGAIVLYMDDYLPPGQTFVSFTSNGGTIGGFSWTCSPVANTLDTNVTDVQCQLPTNVATLATFLVTGTIPTVDVTGTFNAAAQTLDYAPNYTNTADFYVLDPPAGVAQLAGVVTDANVLTTPAAPVGTATISLSKTATISSNGTVTFTLTPSIVGTGTIPAGTVITVVDALPPQIALPVTSITSLPVNPNGFTPLTLTGNLLTTSFTVPAGGITAPASLPVITITGQLASGVAPCSFIQNEASISAVAPAGSTATFLPVVVSSIVQVPGTNCGGTATPSGAPALSLSKTGVRHGNMISYTLLSSIVGGGSVPAGTVITLTDALPTQVTLVPGSVLQSLSTTPWTINVSGNTITATLTAPAGGIAAGTLLPAIIFDAQINAGTKAGTIIENEATISAPGFAPVSASSTIEIGEQHQQCKNNCHHEQNECKNNCHHEQNECRNDCHHECPRVANHDCEKQCAHVANWDNWECDHNNNDANTHSGSSKGGNKIIIINEANSSSKSHSGSASNSSSNSHSNSDSKGSHSNNADAKSHSGSSDAKSHSGSSDAKSHSGSMDSKNHSESKDSKGHSGSSDGHTQVIVIER